MRLPANRQLLWPKYQPGLQLWTLYLMIYLEATHAIFERQLRSTITWMINKIRAIPQLWNFYVNAVWVRRKRASMKNVVSNSDISGNWDVKSMPICRVV
jgi:hypothetical protein